MVDNTESIAMNDPVLPQTDAALDNIDLFTQDPQLFDTIDPSLTLTATPSFNNAFSSELGFPRTQSMPCSPLLHGQSDPLDPCFGDDINLSNHPLPPSPEPYHPRAHSQPPEEVTFHRSSGHYLGRPTGSRHPFPAAAKANKRVAEQKDWRQPPYARSSHGPAGRGRRAGPPTSTPVYAPSSPMMRPMNMGTASGPRSNPLPLAVTRPQPQPQLQLQLHSQPQPNLSRGLIEVMPHELSNINDQNEMELWTQKLGEPQDRRELTLGMLKHVERMTQECEKIKGLILRGSNATQAEKNETDGIILEKRKVNGAVTGLDQPLELLPVPTASTPTEGEDVLAQVPKSGRDIRDLDQEAMTALLSLYDIPYISTMFLHEKKDLYLRFIGASRALMHQVLD